MPAFDPVGLEFFEQAPQRFTTTEVIPRAASVVFAALTDDPSTWTWFPGFSDRGRWLTAGPHGQGSRRQVRMAGVTYDETILAWDEPVRFAFRIDRASVGIARALAEDYRLEANSEQSTAVTWTFAIDARRLLRLGMPTMPSVLPRVFRRAMANLTTRLKV